MGVEWGDEIIVLKPFLETSTFQNVSATRAAVVNLTDDAMLFAQGAISSPQFPWLPAQVVQGAVLQAACSWRELEVLTIDATPPRSRIEARVVHRGVNREFLGLQSGQARRAGSGHPRHPDPSPAGGADSRRVRPAPGHRGQDRRTPGAGGDGAC